MGMLHSVTGAEEGESLEDADIEKVAQGWLLSYGVSKETINMLKEKLR